MTVHIRTPAAGGLMGSDGSFVSVAGGLGLSSGALTATAGSGGSSGPRPRQYEVSARDGSFTITSPAYLTGYAENAGTIVAVRAMLQASSGFNMQYTLMHALPGQAGQPVPGLQNIGVDDGEAGADGKVGIYSAPLVTKPTGTVTYAVGDQLYFTFSAVGGTPTFMTMHLSVLE